MEQILTEYTDHGLTDGDCESGDCTGLPWLPWEMGMAGEVAIVAGGGDLCRDCYSGGCKGQYRNAH